MRTKRTSGLLEAHAIPSLNFSSINLLAKLNDALELRRASLGSDFDSFIVHDEKILKTHSAFEEKEALFEKLVEEGPVEQVEQGEQVSFREKYKSVFLGLDAPEEAPVVKQKDEIGEEEVQSRPNSLDTLRIPTFRPPLTS